MSGDKARFERAEEEEMWVEVDVNLTDQARFLEAGANLARAEAARTVALVGLL